MDFSRHKEFDVNEFAKAHREGGYITIPTWGVPSNPEWAPGTRQWIAPGTTLDGTTATGTTGATRQPTTRDGSSVGGSNSMGGSSSIDYDSIRERAIAPTRAVYQNAIRNLNRQKALGITSPGYGAQLAKLSRGMSQGMADASIGAESSIADMMMREKAMQQDYALRSRGLDISEKSLPSGLTQGIQNTAGLMNLASAGASAAGTIYDIYSRNRQQGGGTSTGTSTGQSGIIPSGYGSMFGGQTQQPSIFGNYGGYQPTM